MQDSLPRNEPVVPFPLEQIQQHFGQVGQSVRRLFHVWTRPIRPKTKASFPRISNPWETKASLPTDFEIRRKRGLCLQRVGRKSLSSDGFPKSVGREAFVSHGFGKRPLLSWTGVQDGRQFLSPVSTCVRTKLEVHHRHHFTAAINRNTDNQAVVLDLRRHSPLLGIATTFQELQS
eukprot:scaffold19142_cov83-Cylindrotheca_fusiformis.AAC.2